MYYAKQNNGSLITADQAQKGKAYFCPHCAEAVILRQGTIKRAHFTHMKRNCRPYHCGETLTHYNAKYRLAQQLQLLGYEVQIEPQIQHSSRIPDLLLNYKVVLELQFSTIPLVELQRRTSNYETLGYTVCWVVLLPSKKYNYLNLTDFQSACIQPHLRRLFTWHPINERLYVITQIMAYGHKKFKGVYRKVNQFTFDHFSGRQIVKTTKIPAQSILKYIHSCRQRKSVLEPTLSLMYQLQLTDQWVAKHLGYVYPEQILITTHPVLWQLRYIYELQLSQDQVTTVLNSLKRWTFATAEHNTTLELRRLIMRFGQQYKMSKQYNVQN